MSCFRPVRLTSVVLCLQGFAALIGVPLKAQTPPPPAPQQPAQSAPSAPQNPPPSTANPFETVPENKAPEQIGPTVQVPNQAGTITGIEFRGNRRVPADTLRALIFTKVGDPYNVDTLHRDFIALWNTNRFDDIRLETEPGESGGIILRFVMMERPVIRTINYDGAKSVSTSASSSVTRPRITSTGRTIEASGERVNGGPREARPLLFDGGLISRPRFPAAERTRRVRNR